MSGQQRPTNAPPRDSVTRDGVSRPADSGSRRTALGVAILAGVVLAVTAVLVLLAAITPRDTIIDTYPAHPDVESVRYTPSQALPDFDGSTRTMRDPAKIQDLVDALDSHAWQPGWEASTADRRGCPGGRSADLTLNYVDGTSDRIEVTDSCTGADDLQTAVLDVVFDWP